MECPVCKLINLPDAVRCDCGYDFQTKLATPKPRPLYAQFVSLLLGSVLLTSVVAFSAADAVARNQGANIAVVVVATALAVVLARSAWTAWGLIAKSDVAVARRLRVSSVVIAFCVVTGSAIVGTAIGQNGAEAVQLAADISQMNTVGNRISKLREVPENTMASYVKMYANIEADVQELEPVLRRLTSELREYHTKFTKDKDTEKAIANVDIALRRMVLLKQQIEVAKKIGTLDGNEQATVWQQQMRPLLVREDELDKPTTTVPPTER